MRGGRCVAAFQSDTQKPRSVVCRMLVKNPYENTETMEEKQQRVSEYENMQVSPPPVSAPAGTGQVPQVLTLEIFVQLRSKAISRRRHEFPISGGRVCLSACVREMGCPFSDRARTCGCFDVCGSGQY